MGYKEFDHCGGAVWNRLGRVKLIRNWPTNCGHTRYVLLRENILIDTCKHGGQTTAKGEERVTRPVVYPHGRSKTAEKRLPSPWYTCRSYGSPGVDPRPMELLYAVLLFLVTISVYLCNWYLVDIWTSIRNLRIFLNKKIAINIIFFSYWFQNYYMQRKQKESFSTAQF